MPASKGSVFGWLGATARGGFRLFGVIVIGLFLMLVSTSCAEMGAAYVLLSEDVAEKVISVPLAFAASLLVAAAAAAAFFVVSKAVSTGYRVLFGAAASGEMPTAPLPMVGVGLFTVVLSAAIGGWRLHAGYAGGEPGFVMQGTVVAAVGVIVGSLLLVPYLVLALRPSARDQRRRTKRPGADEADEPVPAEFRFTLFAVLGIVASFGVVEVVHLARAQAGEAPLPMGEFVDGRLRQDGFQGYPEEAELALPGGLQGPHAIVFIEVEPCAMKLVDDRGAPVRTQRIAKEVDEDGDTRSYARLVFEAAANRRYRLRLTPDDEKCRYTVRLVRAQEEK